VLVQPVAAIEQHGPHLPLATDLIVADAACEAVMAERGAELDLWLLPSLAYGRSVEHTWAPGTITLSTNTLLAVLDDIGRSVATTAATRLAFVNGHGGNTSLLNVACRDLRLRYGLMTFLLHPSLPPDHGGTTSGAGELGMGIHGGHAETSLLLHLRPDLVDMAQAARRVPEHLDRFEHVGFGKAVAFGWLSNDFHPSGVIGDPTGATAEAGKAAFQQMVATLGAQLAEVAEFRL
jgi:creatinine amidohydrolase